MFAEWRERRLDSNRSYPYLYLDATYVKARWAGAVRSVALLVAVGVSDEGHREARAVEAAPGERTETRRDLLQGLVERGLRGVRLVISDDHESIKSAVQVEVPSAAWQRCAVHFQRNILSHVPQTESKEVAADLKQVFQAARRETAETLAIGFSERYGKRYPKAVASLARGLDEALTYTSFPSSHHRLIRTTNGIERVFESKASHPRGGVSPNEQSAETLATERRCGVRGLGRRKYLDMTPLHALFHQPTTFAT